MKKYRVNSTKIKFVIPMMVATYIVGACSSETNLETGADNSSLKSKITITGPSNLVRKAHEEVVLSGWEDRIFNHVTNINITDIPGFRMGLSNGSPTIAIDPLAFNGDQLIRSILHEANHVADLNTNKRYTFTNLPNGTHPEVDACYRILRGLIAGGTCWL